MKRLLALAAVLLIAVPCAAVIVTEDIPADEAARLTEALVQEKIAAAVGRYIDSQGWPKAKREKFMASLKQNVAGYSLKKPAAMDGPYRLSVTLKVPDESARPMVEFDIIVRNIRSASDFKEIQAAITRIVPAASSPAVIVGSEVRWKIRGMLDQTTLLQRLIADLPGSVLSKGDGGAAFIVYNASGKTDNK